MVKTTQFDHPEWLRLIKIRKTPQSYKKKKYKLVEQELMRRMNKRRIKGLLEIIAMEHDVCRD